MVSSKCRLPWVFLGVCALAVYFIVHSQRAMVGCGQWKPNQREIRSGGGDGEHRNHYTEEVNQPDVGGEDVADANADTAEQLPMSTIADRPAAASQTQAPYWKGREQLHVVVVVCNDRAPEALTMMKSAVMFSASPLVVHIFTQDDLHPVMSGELLSWPDVAAGRVNFKYYPIKYPLGEDAKRWRENFKPCATMRLFIPTSTKIDSVIYVDTDTLFVEPVENLWAHFAKFNSSQLTAVAPETEDLANGRYVRFARHPYYGKGGINSGVMLMNLSRIRESDGGNWNSEMADIFHEYYGNITLGDQDILNIYFSRHPDRLYTYPCEWNYRPDHCMYGVNNCNLSPHKTAKVVHGNRQSFHNDKEYFFRAVYDAFEQAKASNQIDAEEFAESLSASIAKTAGSAGCLVVEEQLVASIKQAMSNLSH